MIPVAVKTAVNKLVDLREGRATIANVAAGNAPIEKLKTELKAVAHVVKAATSDVI
jgi:hypothetical protein